MKEASNLTPIEMAEEAAYNVLTMTSIAGVVSSLSVMLHMVVFSNIFSLLFLTLAIISLVGVFLFMYLKRKRFGYRNYSLGERVKRLEMALGEPV